MLDNIDTQLLHQLNLEWTNPFLDRLLPTVTNLNAWMPVIVVGVLAAVVLGSARVRLLVLAIAVALGLGDGLLSKTLKTAVGRLRPSESRSDVIARALPKAHPAILAAFSLPVVRAGKPAEPGSRGNSFPSSHTINVFSVATLCLLVVGRRTWWTVLLAVLVAWSRVYCGDHWPTDLLASIPLGILCGWISARLVNAAWKKWGGSLFPSSHAQMPSLL